MAVPHLVVVLILGGIGVLLTGLVTWGLLAEYNVSKFDVNCFPAYEGRLDISVNGFGHGSQQDCEKYWHENPPNNTRFDYWYDCKAKIVLTFDDEETPEPLIWDGFSNIEGRIVKVLFNRPANKHFKKILFKLTTYRNVTIWKAFPVTHCRGDESVRIAITMGDLFREARGGTVEFIFARMEYDKAYNCSWTGFSSDLNEEQNRAAFWKVKHQEELNKNEHARLQKEVVGGIEFPVGHRYYRAPKPTELWARVPSLTDHLFTHQ